MKGLSRSDFGFYDLGEYVVPAALAADDPDAAPELVAWRVAADDARAAYAEWRRCRDRDSYAVYRACADRADAAQAVVAAA
jgi:hypothetical protein